MDVMLVLETFILLSGLTKEEAHKWLPLCHWALSSLFGRLQDKVDLVANQRLLCYTAGAMAFYKYTLRTAAKDGTTSFSAGDVKVNENPQNAVAVAKELYEDAIESAKHLFYIDDFWFAEVVAYDSGRKH
jgi:hypothetical protein